MKPKIIIIIGPTASGKSDLAVVLALRLNSGQAQQIAAKKYGGFNGAEIISADSRQVYRGMDIGTGKITKKEMRSIPHHLLGIASPKTRFSVAQFRQKTLQAIKQIYTKNKIPIICGGTGLYIQAVVDGLTIPIVKPDFKLRQQLEKLSIEQLFLKLKKLDPRRAKNIDTHNPRRLIRAIEIVMKSSKPVPLLKTTSQFTPLFIGIKKSPQNLQKLIEKRLLRRLKLGMVAEVKKIRKQGVSWKRLESFGLEYQWLALYLQNKISRQEMINGLNKKIKQYAKRQMTWFKRDKRIHWITNKKEAFKLASKFLD